MSNLAAAKSDSKQKPLVRLMASLRSTSFRHPEKNRAMSDYDQGADLSYVATPASDNANQNSSPASFPVTLYPEIEPYQHGLLPVSDKHKIYYEQCGNPDGPLALLLHGGPGGGCSPRSRRFFDPSYYRIVCIDQRGCGRSIPNAGDDWEAALEDNNTEALVNDIEKLRLELRGDYWQIIVGGSWGSTLTLAYCTAHPKRCRDIVLRGLFLFSPEEVDNLFQNGATSSQNPEAWENYTQFIVDTSSDIQAECTNYLGAYNKRLRSTPQMRKAAASAFIGYELSLSKTYVNPDKIETTLADPKALIPFALFEVVYMLNAGFMRRGQLLDDIHVLVEKRIRIIHGRGDYVCLPKASHLLSKALKKAGAKDVELEFVAGAGHSDSEPGLVDAIVRATNECRERKEGVK